MRNLTARFGHFVLIRLIYGKAAGIKSKIYAVFDYMSGININKYDCFPFTGFILLLCAKNVELIQGFIKYKF